MSTLLLASVLGAASVPSLGPLELGLRVLGAAVLGGLVGLERELANRPAGFRTHILVSLGACLFTMAGAYGVRGFFPGNNVSFDPTRVAAQVVTGIGFLGAGAIIRTGPSVTGLTTAAALWVTAAIGLAVGLGYWSGSVAITAVAVLALYALKRVERGPLKRLERGRYRFVVEAGGAVTLGDLSAPIEAAKGRIETLHMEVDDRGNRRVEVVVQLPPAADAAGVAEALAALRGVSGVDWIS